MTKAKKITIFICSAVIFNLLALYFGLCLDATSYKPGMDGFMVTNGMIKLLASGKDYVKVGEDRYIFRESGLNQLFEEEYDSYSLHDWYISHPESEKDIEQYIEKYGYVTSIFKVSYVDKNGEKLRGVSLSVWGSLSGFSSVYFIPYVEGEYYSEPDKGIEFAALIFSGIAVAVTIASAIVLFKKERWKRNLF